MSDLEHILEKQRALQLRLGYNFTEMTTQEKVNFIKINILALEDELHEALRETMWKPWAHGEPWINRDAYLKEMADALHFALNLYAVVEASAEEILAGYLSKNKVNHTRQDNSYTGQDKCPVCHRAPDEPA